MALTMFLVSFVLVLFTFAGLVVDGSRVVAARRSATGAAASGARLGLQAFGGSLGGEPSVVEAQVQSLVSGYLADRGFPDSSIRVDCAATCDRVVVTTRTTVHFSLGRLVGISSKQVEATVGARQATGITYEGG